MNAREKIEETLPELAPDAEIIFERLWCHSDANPGLAAADAPDQQNQFPHQDVRVGVGRARRYQPAQLRRLVRDAIERRLPPDQFEVLKAAEESERCQLAGLVGMLNGAGIER